MVWYYRFPRQQRNCAPTHMASPLQPRSTTISAADEVTERLASLSGFYSAYPGLALLLHHLTPCKDPSQSTMCSCQVATVAQWHCAEYDSGSLPAKVRDNRQSVCGKSDIYLLRNIRWLLRLCKHSWRIEVIGGLVCGRALVTYISHGPST